MKPVKINIKEVESRPYDIDFSLIDSAVNAIVIDAIKGALDSFEFEMSSSGLCVFSDEFVGGSTLLMTNEDIISGMVDAPEDSKDNLLKLRLAMMQAIIDIDDRLVTAK